MSRTLSLLTISCLVLFSACTKADLPPAPVTVEPEPLSSEKEIISFSFRDKNDAVVPFESIIVELKADTFNLSFPFGTDISHLVTSVQFKGVNIEPVTGAVVDFTHAIPFTVMAEDSTTRKYVVVASVRNFSAVYFGSSNYHFYALDPASGTVLWEHVTPGGYFTYSDPTLSGSTIFTGNTDGHMYAFDAHTGAVKWKFFTDGTGIESPASVHDGTVYFGANNDYFYALNEATGDVKWTFQTYGNVSTRPVFFEGKVIFGSSDASVYALDAATGMLQWQYVMGAMANQSSPALSNGVVFIGSRDTYLHAIDASTGNMKWKFNDGPYSMEMSTPIVHDGKVVIGSWYDLSTSQPGSMYAVDEETGELVWKTLDGMGIGADPFVYDGKLFISPDDGQVHALNLSTGSRLWSYTIYPNGATASALDNTVYVGGGGTGYFYALDIFSGMVKWKFATPGGLMTSAPLVVN